MAYSRTKYPPGSTLRCACGRQGSVAVVAGHRGLSKNPLCHKADKLEIIALAPDNPVAPVAATPDNPPDAFKAFDENEASGVLPGPGFTPTEETDPGIPAIPYYSVPDPAPRPAPKSSTRQTAVQRGEAKMEWRQPAAPKAGADPAPGFVVVNVELPTKVLELYNAFRSNPELAYEGTLSQWLAMNSLRYVELLGYQLALVRNVPQAMGVG